MTPPPKRAGMVRLDEGVRAEVDAYAEQRGIGYNAAMNILVRAGLRAEQSTTKTTTRRQRCEA
jgi:hypothetical protein